MVTETPGWPAAELDCRDLLCPLPVLRLAAAVDGVHEPTTIDVLTTDPAALTDLPAWGRMRRHRVRRLADEADGAARHRVWVEPAQDGIGAQST